MPTQVRSLQTDAEFDAYLRAASYAFHTVRDEALIERYRTIYRPEWCLGAFDGSTLVAGLTIIPFEQHMLGARIPFGGIATVASLPEHRRGGHVGQLLSAALSRMQDSGQVLSGLYTPHFSLYRRFGWEPSYRIISYSLGPKTVKLRTPRPPGTYTRMAADSWAELAAIRDESLARANGPLSRDEARWRSQVLREGDRVHDAVIWTNAGGVPRGYCVYVQQQRPARGAGNETVIRVVDLVALDGPAHTALLHYLLSHDLAARIIILASEEAPIPALVDEPALIDEPQGAYIGMALRLVDVSAALRARPAGPGSDGVTINVRINDATAPWNEGIWSWTSTDGKIDVSPTSAPPDVAIDAANLGPIYNGFMSTETASRAGLIDASTPASCSRLQALLGTTSRPFCNDDF